MNNPISTYRIQFHKDFTLEHLDTILPYLQKLGIGAIYASPIFEAVSGSTHGYNGTNPHRINPEIGTEEQLTEISKKLKEYNIQWIQDIAPNHMAFHLQNSWLMDVLKKGEKSIYAPFFDINWDHTNYKGKLMVPFAGSELDTFLQQEKSESPCFEVCGWQETDRQINYRRFFTVNDLICLNIQNTEVFDIYHRYVKQLYDNGIFQGLRIDHIDGLFDPSSYLHNIRGLVGKECYLVVEKIMALDENMPQHWPVQGSTGYDFLAFVNNLFTQSSAREAFTDFYTLLIEDKKAIEDQVLEKKAYILNHFMQGELENLYQLFLSLELADKADLDNVGHEVLKQAIGEVLIECPVYRYYGNQMPLQAKESNSLKSILVNIMKRNLFLKSAVDLLEQALLITTTKGDEAYNRRALHFYQRMMQFSSPLMAKGVEDTLMYTYNRFIGHNEVGDAPENFGLSAIDFHKKMINRQQQWPLSMNATATHDTKRGEDVRARLNVLTELNDEWIQQVQEWYKLNTDIQKEGAPDINDEYFIYQSLLGAYPMPGTDAGDFENRFIQYLDKAMREGKRKSSWATPNEAYENSTHDFVRNLLDTNRPFWKSFAKFHEKVANLAIVNSLSQLTLKLTCPGVPDTYQGCEWWDFSFVDPDNRRPVNYNEREEILKDENKDWEALWSNSYNGHIKLRLLQCLLQMRRQHPKLFQEGDYIPLVTKGKYAEYVFAFARRHQDKWCVVAVPLFHTSLCKEQDRDKPRWIGTSIVLPDKSPAQLRNVFTEENIASSKEIAVSEVFNRLAVTVLLSI